MLAPKGCANEGVGGVLTAVKIADAVNYKVKVKTDISLTGDGTDSAPLSVNVAKIADSIDFSVASDSTLTGNGTPTNPLAVNVDKIAELVAEKMGADDEGLCTVPLRTVTSTTILDDDGSLISTGGTITFPQGLTVGRQFSIIQSGTNTVTLAGATGVSLIPPYEGGTILAGNNAVVTALVSAQNVIRLFGQTSK